jgi:phosphate starvation-inducible PhoH-like protein
MYHHLLNNHSVPIVIATGPAGTGKTYMATRTGALKVNAGVYKKLILTRPAVSVDESHGYLPGDIDDKMKPWTRPLYDILSPLRVKPSAVEICPLAYMRGRTFDNCWIIADEMQNSTPGQMKMLLTRVGKNTKLVITGDTDQHDNGFEVNGLRDFVTRLGDSELIKFVQFSEDDIVRSEVVREVLKFYT